jgi:ankyrin repeat protein
VTIDEAAAAADADAVFALLDADRSLATARAGCPSWPPLLHLCCSRQRRGDPDAAGARVRIARRLLDLGADVNAAGFEDGFTSPNVTQMYAIETGASSSAAALVEAGVPIGNAFAAAGVDRVELLAGFLAHGADVNGRYTGWSSTLLLAAAGMGHAEAVRFLIACGADRTLRNVWGGTPAGTARYFGHAEVASLIEPAPLSTRKTSP